MAAGGIAACGHFCFKARPLAWNGMGRLGDLGMARRPRGCWSGMGGLDRDWSRRT